MEQKMYDHIKNNINKLDIDLDVGKVLNRKTFDRGNGYLTVCLHYKLVSVHQLIAFLKFDEECVGKNINHIDGNKQNNAASNLELCTQAENVTHAVKMGLTNRKGSLNHKAKLSERDIPLIFERLSTGETQASIAKYYKVSEAQISLIANGKAWKHVKYTG